MNGLMSGTRRVSLCASVRSFRPLVPLSSLVPTHVWSPMTSSSVWPSLSPLESSNVYPSLLPGSPFPTGRQGNTKRYTSGMTPGKTEQRSIARCVPSGRSMTHNSAPRRPARPVPEAKADSGGVSSVSSFSPVNGVVGGGESGEETLFV